MKPKYTEIILFTSSISMETSEGTWKKATKCNKRTGQLRATPDLARDTIWIIDIK